MNAFKSLFPNEFENRANTPPDFESQRYHFSGWTLEAPTVEISVAKPINTPPVATSTGAVGAHGTRSTEQSCRRRG